MRAAYLALLGRHADPTGLAHYVVMLEAGMPREDVMFELADSEEHRAIMRSGLPDHSSLRRPGDPALDDLRTIRPDRYHATHDPGGREMLVFQVGPDRDFDWLEEQIRRTGYYEHDGVWTMGVDNDKRIMAELLAAFGPRRVLEIGCASGAVLVGLAAREIEVTGVDLSELARSGAPDSVRERIVLGDLLEVDLDGPFDLVVGLDVFEHLNPNRIDEYLARAAALLDDHGWFVANIPAFGPDPVFGDVHGDFLADGHELHRVLQVDDRGYPVNGHLIWATWWWWQERLQAAGLHRVVEVEHGIQQRYGEYWRGHYPARASVFVFRKSPPGSGGTEPVVAALRAPSPLVAEFAQPPAPGTASTDR